MDKTAKTGHVPPLLSLPDRHFLTTLLVFFPHRARIMASIKKRPDGKWRVQIDRRGVRKSKVCASRAEAKDWAARQEYLILNTKPDDRPVVRFGDVMQRYANEVSPKKRGERWETVRLSRIGRDSLAEKAIGEIEAKDIAAWRDKRLREVAPGSVNREMVLLSAVFTVARKEWGLIDVNPMADVRKPSKPPPRDRLVTDREMEALAISAGDDLSNATARAFHAFRFAIETAMRAGEITGLTWNRVNLERRVVDLPMTKNGTSRRVPLSSEAVRLLEALPSLEPVFGLEPRSLDVLWRKLRDRAGVADLRFHDSRHEAITRLARKLDVLDLARMVGHRNISQLQAYYNASAEDIAKRLD